MAKIQFEISNLKSFNKALQEAINKDNLVKDYITRGTMKVHKTAVEGIQDVSYTHLKLPTTPFV